MHHVPILRHVLASLQPQMAGRAHLRQAAGAEDGRYRRDFGADEAPLDIAVDQAQEAISRSDQPIEPGLTLRPCSRR
jgi:hypothetical protein